jgi:hypothetical protein
MKTKTNDNVIDEAGPLQCVGLELSQMFDWYRKSKPIPLLGRFHADLLGGLRGLMLPRNAFRIYLFLNPGPVHSTRWKRLH